MSNSVIQVWIDLTTDSDKLPSASAMVSETNGCVQREVYSVLKFLSNLG